MRLWQSGNLQNKNKLTSEADDFYVFMYDEEDKEKYK
jgi:hypothetical protein